MKIRILIGFGLIIIGLGWSLLNKFLCNKLCATCNYAQLSPCYFLFLFVGIIFIVDGVGLILTQKFKHSEKK